MPKRAEGTCDGCGETVGVQLADSLAMLAGGSIERMMERDGNAVKCTRCDKYVSPDDMSLEE